MKEYLVKLLFFQLNWLLLLLHLMLFTFRVDLMFSIQVHHLVFKCTDMHICTTHHTYGLNLKTNNQGKRENNNCFCIRAFFLFNFLSLYVNWFLVSFRRKQSLAFYEFWMYFKSWGAYITFRSDFIQHNNSAGFDKC